MEHNRVSRKVGNLDSPFKVVKNDFSLDLSNFILVAVFRAFRVDMGNIKGREMFVFKVYALALQDPALSANGGQAKDSRKLRIYALGDNERARNEKRMQKIIRYFLSGEQLIQFLQCFSKVTANRVNNEGCRCQVIAVVCCTLAGQLEFECIPIGAETLIKSDKDLW